MVELVVGHDYVVILEDNAIAGGADSAVNEFLIAHDLRKPTLNIGTPERFVEHGSRHDCLRDAGLDAAGIHRSLDFWLAAQQPQKRPPRVV